MKKTGDDELDFIREAGSELLSLQSKGYYRIVLPIEAVSLVVLTGLIALMSITVALWVLTVLGGLLLIQAGGVTFMQYKARRFFKKSTQSQEALDNVTGDMWSL